MGRFSTDHGCNRPGILIAEMFNSAIEALCDFIETHENHKIKVIKDISAAAAGISILLWTVILVVEFLHLRRIIAKP